MDPKLFDKRVLKRNLTNGLVTKEEYDKYIASLPDTASMAEPVREKLYEDSEKVEAPAVDIEA